jgi:hypothetical protein
VQKPGARRNAGDTRHLPRYLSSRLTGARGPWHDVPAAHDDHQRWPSVTGNHDGACVPKRLADRCASSRRSLTKVGYLKTEMGL